MLREPTRLEVVGPAFWAFLLTVKRILGFLVNSETRHRGSEQPSLGKAEFLGTEAGVNFSAPTGQYTRANRISMEGHAGLGVEERGAQTCVENPPFDWKRGPEPVIGVFLPVIEVSFVKTCTRVSGLLSKYRWPRCFCCCSRAALAHRRGRRAACRAPREVSSAARTARRAALALPPPFDPL